MTPSDEGIAAEELLSGERSFCKRMIVRRYSHQPNIPACDLRDRHEPPGLDANSSNAAKTQCPADEQSKLRLSHEWRLTKAPGMADDSPRCAGLRLNLHAPFLA